MQPSRQSGRLVPTLAGIAALVAGTSPAPVADDKPAAALAAGIDAGHASLRHSVVDKCCGTCGTHDFVPCADHAVLDHFRPTLTHPDLGVGAVAPAAWPWLGPAAIKDPRHIYLFLLSDGHSGSSATSGLLSSSPNISNLCTAKVWQCEGEKLLLNEHQFTVKFRNHLKKNGRGTGINTTLVDEEINWKKAMMYYRMSWDLSRAVLLDKSPAFLAIGPWIGTQMRKLGLRAAFIVMSHSICTMSTREHNGGGKALQNGHARHRPNEKLPNTNMHNWNRTNAGLVSSINGLKAAGENVIHLRYEAMMADPQRFADIIEAFLPAVTDIDIRVNGLGDATAGDRAVSIKEYADTHPLQNTCTRYPRSWGRLVEGLGYTA